MTHMIGTSTIRLSAAALVLTAAASPLSAARAQGLERAATGITDMLQIAVDLLPADVTRVSLGIGPSINPDYEGSDHSKISAVPVVSLRYRDILEVDNNEVKFTAFNRLFDSNTRLGNGSLRIGPLASVNFGRGEGASTKLMGMGGVGTALELGAFASYALPGSARLRLRARHDVVSGHGGALVTIDLTQPFIRGERFAVGAGVAGTWASGPYMRSYFGVTAAQAAASGYPVFRPGAAFKDVALNLSGNYTIAPRWSVVGSAGYKRLMGAAADSPLVRLVGSASQLSFSAFVVYQY